MSPQDEAIVLTHIVASNFRDTPCRCVSNSEGKHDPTCAPWSFMLTCGSLLLGMRHDRERLIREEQSGWREPPATTDSLKLPW